MIAQKQFNEIPVIADNVKWIHSGRFKNLLNYAMGMGQELLLVESVLNLEIVKENYANVRIFESYEQIISYLSEDKVQFFIIDDKSVSKFRKILYKAIIYVYPIRGLWGLGGLPIKYVDNFSTKLRFLLERFGMNRIILKSYISDIKLARLIITQSYTSSGVLRYYYGIQPDLVLFNPVNLGLFKPIIPVEEKFLSKEILVFLGTGYGDTNLSILAELSEVASKNHFKVNLFGNKGRVKYFKKCNYEYYNDISDNDLVSLYSRSKITIIPQLDEPISYVAIESLATGTPVICAYPEESVSVGVDGYYSSSTNFVHMLEKFLLEINDKSYYNALFTNALSSSKKYDMDIITRKIYEYLEKVYG
jgi:glycosyltransferase involved in cell wall biosynthesis